MRPAFTAHVFVEIISGLGFVEENWSVGRVSILRHRYWVDELFSEIMINPDNRKYPRLKQNFEVQIYRHGLDLALDGVSVNISQGGAFIKTRDWQSFRVRDTAVFAFLLPPRFTGQDKTIGLQGGAVVSRIDKNNQGIGVEFVRNFRLFELIDVPNAVGDHLK